MENGFNKHFRDMLNDLNEAKGRINRFKSTNRTFNFVENEKHKVIVVKEMLITTMPIYLIGIVSSCFAFAYEIFQKVIRISSFYVVC